MSADRISKKQMKEDKLVSTAFKFSEYIQNNSKQFIIGVSVAIGVFLIVLFMNWQSNRQLAEAQLLFTRANLSMDMGNIDEAVVDFKVIVNDYSGALPAAQACFLLSNILYEKGEYDEAIIYFEILMSKYSDDNVKGANGAGGLGSCYEIKGEFALAAGYYKKAADFSADAIFSPGFLMQAGENYQAVGDVDAAKACYQQIVDDYTNSKEIQNAKRSLATLEL